MSDKQPQETKLFLMNLKAQPTKAGGTFYTGKLGSLDVLGFLKKDNSGTITLWVKQAPMRDYGQPTKPQQGYAQPPPSQLSPRITPRAQPIPSDNPPEDLWDRDESPYKEF